ncbi:MAG: S-layer family protein [Cyanobacteria bacterium]|nr:S-layer family protein [Cyanobacteriota bacterium]MDW8200636.1 S-layer family protein [Cyanobacteriota bacterium SKYGB_h_bin112]
MTAQRVSLLNGGQLRFADSRANNPTAIVVNASDQLVISGANSGIFSTARPSIRQDPVAMQVTARTVSLLNGGQLRIADLGINNPTAIAVTATDQLLISGANSGIFSDTQSDTRQGGAVTLASNAIQISDSAMVETSTTGAAAGGNISLSAPTVNITAGGKLQTSAWGIGQAGDITLGMAANPTGRITISDPTTVVQSTTTANGNGGNITLMGDLITVANNASVGISTTGAGNAGNITLAAQNQVTLQSGGTIASATSSDGASGLVKIAAPVIAMDASQIVTSTAGSGHAGTITLSGSDRINIANNSQIRSQVSTSTATGQGGNIQFTTPNLTVSRSLVSAETIGQGNGGTLTAQAQRLQLAEGGALQTLTAGSGNTGTLSLAVTNSTTLTSQAQIRAIVGIGATGNSLPVQLVTPSLSLDGGAQVLSRVSGNATGGEVQIRVGTIALAGGSAIQSLVESEFGTGSNVRLQTNALTVNNAAIRSVNRGSRQGGQLAITTDGDIVLTGGQVLTSTELGNGSGTAESQGGNVIVRGRSLQLNQGSQLATNITTNGQGGAIDISTSEPIRLAGSESDLPQTFITSVTAGNNSRGTGGTIRLTAPTVELASNAVVSSTTASAGNGGNLQITTNVLTLTQGGQLRVTASGAGNSGDIEIASRSRLTIADPNTGIFATTTPTATGNAGNITIHPDVVLLRNEGTIAAISNGSGSGGNISLQGNGITLQNRAAIVTETASGQGGNIAIQLQDLLFLRDAGLISATSPTAGSGSNLRFSGGYIIGFPSENSDIIATTVGGTGGTIQIASRGVFGFTPRTDSSAISDITTRASLQVQGQTIVTTLGDDPSKGLIQLPDDVLDTSNQIVVGCPAEGGNKFTIPGRGGLLPNPSEIVNLLPTLIDWGDDQANTTVQEGQDPEVSSSHPSPALFSTPEVSVDSRRSPQSSSPPELSPAHQWVRLPDGKVILVGYGSLQSWPLSSSCSSPTRSGP